MRVIIFDFGDPDYCWREDHMAKLREAGIRGRNRFQLVKMPETCWINSADLSLECHRCNLKIFNHLAALPLGDLEANDLILASAVDPNNLVALYRWYEALNYPRPGLMLQFTRLPWHFAPERQGDVLALASAMFATWTMTYPSAVRLSASSPNLAALLPTLDGFHEDARVEVSPGPPDELAEAGLFLRWLLPLKNTPGTPDPAQARILIFAPFGEWQVHHQLDWVVAARLQNSGHYAHIMVCDGLYQSCSITIHQQSCPRCQLFQRQLSSSFDIDQSRVSQWLGAEEIDAVQRWSEQLAVDSLMEAHYDDIPAGELVASTLFTHFRITSTQQISAANIVQTHRRFLAGAVLSYLAVDRAIRDLSITRLLLFNGRLYPYKAAAAAARQNGLDFLVHERGRIENSFEFFENINCVDLVERKKHIEEWAKIPLNAGDISRIENILERKLSGNLGAWSSYYSNFFHLDSEFHEILDIPRKTKLIGYFSSSADEVSQEPGYEDVNKQFTLIEQLADLLEGTDYILVVRHHPAIGGGGPNLAPEVTGLSLAYTQNAAPVRHNLRIIMPNDPIKSSTLYPHLDAAVAPFSSVAVELLASGVRTIVSPVSDLSLSPVDQDPLTLASFEPGDVRQALDHLLSGIDQFDDEYFRRCYRSINALYGMLPIEFSSFGIKDLFEARLNFTNPRQLVGGFDPELDRLFDFLTAGGRFYPNPTVADHHRSTVAEDDYMAAKRGIFGRYRLERSESRAAPTRAAPPLPAILLVDIALPGSARRDCDNLYGCNHRWLNLVPRSATDWASQVKILLNEAGEEWIWLGSPRFILNGIFATRCGKLLRTFPQDLVALPLAGWFALKDRTGPERVATAKLDVGKLADLCIQAGGLADLWAILGLAVWRRSVLQELILPAIASHSDPRGYSIALVAAMAGQSIEINEPIFFNR